MWEVLVIIINDGSTDGSETICDEYANIDSRVRTVHQERRGLSNARNVGLSIMTGKLVAFLDSDDAYDPNCIRFMVEALHHEKADIVVCKHTSHNTIGKMKYSGQERLEPSATQGLYDRRSALRALADGKIDHYVWDKLYKRELWENTRFPGGHVYEDIETTFQIINKSKSVYVLNCPLYLHRKHSESITSTNSWSNIRDRYLAQSHFDKFIQENTPEIFTIDQLKRRQTDFFKSLVVLYLQNVNQNNVHSEISKGEIRENINEIVEHLGNKKYSILYNMVFCFPNMMARMYGIYAYVRSAIVSLAHFFISAFKSEQ